MIEGAIDSMVVNMLEEIDRDIIVEQERSNPGVNEALYE